MHLRNPNSEPNSGKGILEAQILDRHSWVEFQTNSPSRNSPPKIHPPKFNPESGGKIHIAPLLGHFTEIFSEIRPEISSAFLASKKGFPQISPDVCHQRLQFSNQIPLKHFTIVNTLLQAWVHWLSSELKQVIKVWLLQMSSQGLVAGGCFKRGGRFAIWARPS